MAEAMEFGSQFAQKTGEMVTSAVIEGGAVAGGFLASGFLGRQIENAIKTDVTKDSPGADKLVAWAANNVPKFALWYLLKEIGPDKPEQIDNMGQLILVDAKKAALASVFFDTIVRLANDGVNQVRIKLWGIDILEPSGISDAGVDMGQLHETQNTVNRVIAENSDLRTELNLALQRLAASPALETPVLEGGETEGERLRREHGFMQPEEKPVKEKYGFMQEGGIKKKFGFMSDKPSRKMDEAGATFGMV